MTKRTFSTPESPDHRKLETKLRHVQPDEATFRETSDDFTVKVANKPKETRAPLEEDFECSCHKDELSHFRKRK